MLAIHQYEMGHTPHLTFPTPVSRRSSQLRWRCAFTASMPRVSGTTKGVTIALAVQPLDAIARAAAADVHPPLYYWLLHGWVLLMGPAKRRRARSARCAALPLRF